MPRNGKVHKVSSPRYKAIQCQRIYWVLLFVVLAFSCYIASSGRFLSTSEDGRQSGHLFIVADLIGKGKGLVASRNIQQGQLVIRERPLFILPPKISSSPTSLISQTLEQLTQGERDSFFNLSFVNLPKHSIPEGDPAQIALAIFQTNAVAAGNGVGLFPRMARLNHGCSRSFNVVYSWRDKEGVLVVHALRPIMKGEELLTSYTDTKRVKDERRKFLAQHYGFHCSCEVCSLPEAASSQSDRRLVAMAAMYRQLGGWSQGGISGKQAIAIVNDIWELGEEEGYWSERGQLAADAARVAISHSDAMAVNTWATLAIKWYTSELGSDSQEVINVKDMLRNPELHYAWGSRQHMSVGRPNF